ncbi:AraC family transcriptional regulator [Enterococcus timonensis]|uniref:AraC family transcriptional regulator n=1 Tax=Enterococcus timonensis TaxID=1852364 RepID=UPI0008D949BC|nr:AraC family transcriptional regulator [Enterococcus timonensis]
MFPQFVIEKRIRKTPFAMRVDHHHPEYEIYYLAELTGTAQIEIADHFYPLQKGSLVIINAGLPHRTDFSQASAHTRFLIELQPDTFAKNSIPFLTNTPAFFFAQQTGVYDLSANQQKQVSEIFETLYNESLFRESFFESRQFLKIVELLLLLTRFTKQQAQDVELGLKQQETIQPVVRFVADHFEDDLHLASVAERFYLNKSYLARIFKAYTGQTLQDFLNTKRVSQSQRYLLLYPDLPLDEIAKSCGFSSEAHFSKTFKRYTGTTPRRFLKNES